MPERRQPPPKFLDRPYEMDSGCSTRNPTEAGVAEHLEGIGYEVLNKGWPDFLAVHKTTGDVRFIEVKPNKGAALSGEQKRVAEILATLGIKVERCTPTPPPREPPRTGPFATLLQHIHVHDQHSVAIVGSRGYSRTYLVADLVDQLPPHVAILSGGAKGVDRTAANRARKLRRTLTEIIPDWSKHGKAAGLLRNTNIVQRASVVVAFWDGQSTGTKDSIVKAVHMNRPLFVYGHDGQPLELQADPPESRNSEKI